MIRINGKVSELSSYVVNLANNQNPKIGLDFDTLDSGNSRILACTCTLDEEKTLTIGEGTALHVYYNGMNIEGMLVVEDGESVINGIFQ